MNVIPAKAENMSMFLLFTTNASHLLKDIIN